MSHALQLVAWHDDVGGAWRVHKQGAVSSTWHYVYLEVRLLLHMDRLAFGVGGVRWWCGCCWCFVLMFVVAIPCQALTSRLAELSCAPHPMADFDKKKHVS